jgi:hypothetical protein
VSILGPSGGTERGGDLCHGVAVGEQDLPKPQADASVFGILSNFLLFKDLKREDARMKFKSFPSEASMCEAGIE